MANFVYSSSLVVMGTVLGRVDLLEIVEEEREEDMGVEKRKIVLRQNILHPGEEFGSDDHAVLGLRSVLSRPFLASSRFEDSYFRKVVEAKNRAHFIPYLFFYEPQPKFPVS